MAGSLARNCNKLYKCIQKHLFHLVKRRIDSSGLLKSISNVRFYLNDSESLKSKILEEVSSLCNDPKTLRIVSEECDFYLKNGQKLLASMDTAIKDVLEKDELGDLIRFYD
jgi:hypothetical protein